VGKSLVVKKTQHGKERTPSRPDSAKGTGPWAPCVGTCRRRRSSPSCQGEGGKRNKAWTGRKTHPSRSKMGGTGGKAKRKNPQMQGGGRPRYSGKVEKEQ